jgi:hypothetical protein
MNLLSKSLLAVGLGVVFTALTVVAQGVPFNQRTTVTFGQPVEVPGAVLPAGRYTFTIANQMGNRNIVRIWNAAKTRLITTVMGIPDYSVRAPGRTVLMFHERPSNTPEALKAWFYPGFNTGLEFVYPLHQAEQLARLNKQDVPAETGTASARNVRDAHIALVTPSQHQKPLDRGFEQPPMGQ